MQGLRKWGLGRVAIMGMVAVLLAACKADEVEIDLAIEQLKAVAAGEEVTAEFEAVFSNLGELDDFQLERTDLGFEVTVEGELPVLGVDRADHAYYLSVTESASLPGYYRVSDAPLEDRVRLIQKGGAFDSTGAGFFVRLDG